MDSYDWTAMIARIFNFNLKTQQKYKRGLATILAKFLGACLPNLQLSQLNDKYYYTIMVIKSVNEILDI